MSEEFSAPGFWRCAKDTPIGRLSRALGIPETFCIELSAYEWDDDARLMADLARSFSFPTGFGYNWHAVEDSMGDFVRGNPRFLVVIRDIPDSPAARACVAALADSIGPENPDDPKQCVVLDDWREPTLEVRWGNDHRVWPVRPLKTS